MSKITIDRAIVEQALDALDPPEHLRFGGTGKLKTAAITALRQALEQPNKFNPDWDQIKPFNDRIAELEKVAKQALDALDPPEHLRFGGTGKLKTASITTLRQALEQPAEQQEPVLYVHPSTYAMESANQIGVWRPGCQLDDYLPLYSAPQPAKREPLIADEICDSWEFITGHQIQFGPSSEGRSMYLSPDEVIEFARSIEAAHGITGESK